ncbi:MFS general substrate transporter [Pilatotrama ljubarskyi]|nr:MFS general substrate transporter [Pilatotrama ljubarskyi]
MPASPPTSPQGLNTDNGSIPLLPTRGVDGGRVSQEYSPGRRYVLLLVFCLAQFRDVFHNLRCCPRRPLWRGPWLSFASFLLLSGRISDLYDPKLVYVGGMSVLGMLSIGSGFVSNKILLIFMRALMGIAGSLTIPSALALLIGAFPEPSEQALAIGAFAGCGAVGNVLGLTIGAVFAQHVSWRWVFWLVAFFALPIVAGCALIPAKEPRAEVIQGLRDSRWRGLGTVLALLARARPTHPLYLIFMVAGFFYHERTIPTGKAAIPPRTWFLPNFSVLVVTALMPLFWWTTVLTVFVMRWQDVWHWSAVSTAIHLLPVGLVALAISWTAPLSGIVDPKWIILFGEGVCVFGTLLLPFANTSSSIAIFRASPASMAGTVSALFNVSLQLGAALGISLVRTIKADVEARHGGDQAYEGCAAAFWFFLGVVSVDSVVTLVFHRRRKEVEGGM